MESVIIDRRQKKPNNAGSKLDRTHRIQVEYPGIKGFKVSINEDELDSFDKKVAQILKNRKADFKRTRIYYFFNLKNEKIKMDPNNFSLCLLYCIKYFQELEKEIKVHVELIETSEIQQCLEVETMLILDSLEMMTERARKINQLIKTTEWLKADDAMKKVSELKDKLSKEQEEKIDLKDKLNKEQNEKNDLQKIKDELGKINQELESSKKDLALENENLVKENSELRVKNENLEKEKQQLEKDKKELEDKVKELCDSCKDKEKEYLQKLDQASKEKEELESEIKKMKEMMDSRNKINVLKEESPGLILTYRTKLDNETSQIINDGFKHKNDIKITEIETKTEIKGTKFVFKKKGDHRVQIITKKELIDLTDMFFNCGGLIKVEGSIDVRKVMSFYRTFCNCFGLEVISGLSSWDVRNGKDFSCTFDGCSSLADISPLSSWDVRNGTNFQDTFALCSSLVDISHAWMS